MYNNIKISDYDTDIYNNIVITKALNIYKYLYNKYKYEKNKTLFTEIEFSNLVLPNDITINETTNISEKILVYNNHNIKIIMYYDKNTDIFYGFGYNIIINYNNNIYNYSTLFSYEIYSSLIYDKELKEYLLLNDYNNIIKNNKLVNKYNKYYCKIFKYNYYKKHYNKKIYKKIKKNYNKLKKINMLFKFKIILII